MEDPCAPSGGSGGRVAAGGSDMSTDSQARRAASNVCVRWREHGDWRSRASNVVGDVVSIIA